MRFILSALFLVAVSHGGAQTLVLDDFESATPRIRWTGNVRPSAGQTSHGQRSGRLVFDSAHTEAVLAGFEHDWRAFDRLLFDVHSDRDEPHSLSVRIAEDTPGPPALETRFEAADKAVVLKGWNHIEIRLPLVAESQSRNLSLDRIRQIAFSAERVRLPWVVHIDNIRLVKGTESAATASRRAPQDSVTSIDNRWFIVRQAAPPEEVPESRDVTSLRETAVREADRLRAAVRVAQVQGIDTIYSERHLVTADLALSLRSRLPWFNDDVHKRELFQYVAQSCRSARQDVERLIEGVARLPDTDDTHPAEPLAAYPDLKGRPMKDGFFLDRDGRPLFIVSLHSPSQLLQRFFASPHQHIESYTVGGGSRWTIDESPVYEVFQKYPDARRVGWDGWCGHLVRDLDSMGGTKKENVVICLESPEIRRAIDAYIRTEIPKFHANPQLLYDIMAYELSYICYCDRSQKRFREWLGKKHGSIGRANELYGTSYRSFDEVSGPPVKSARPLEGTNRALWYDWARFNMDRFTDHLLWVKSRIRALDATVPLAAGGSSYMLSGSAGTSGIDEERIVNEVDDVIIHEGSGSTLGMDLQLAFAEAKKPLADPEMALDSVYSLLPHALHGKSVMQIYHWPAQPQNEYFHLNAASLAHSWEYSLANVSDLMAATLDARRLGGELAAFAEPRAQVATLYSQTSTLQLPPEMLTWRRTPYLTELEKTYEASRYLDAKTTFVTERQILAGRLDGYKLLLIPAARNVPAGVVEKIWSYVEAGGSVFIAPESLLGDEYNRPQPYLRRLRIEITKTERPKPGTVGAMTQGYDQSFTRDVVMLSGARVKLASVSSREVQAEGIRQTLRAPAQAEPLFRYPDGTAAIVRVRLGRGLVYYSAAALEERSYARLLDHVFEEAGVARPVRVRSIEPGSWKIEARLARVKGRRLLYVINFHDRPVRLRLDGYAGTVTELRKRNDSPSRELTLPARETALYELP